MRLVFMGTPAAAVPSLERLVADGNEIAAVYTQPDRPSGRGNKISFSAVKQSAIDRGLPVLQPTKVRTAEALTEFRSHNADAAIVVAYGRILPETFLTAFPRGAINVHFSLLPKYRGAAPVNWAVVNGETTTGVTTMKMDAGLDTGPILLQRSVEIGREETSIQLMERLAPLGAGLLSETLSRIEELEPIIQDGSKATLAPIMSRDDGLVDWQMPAQQIVDRIRGFQPFPAAFSFHQGNRLRFWKGEAALESSGAPGSVVAASGDELIIACASGSALKVLELQPEGKRRMNVRDFLNGGGIAVGDILGSS